MRLVKTVLIVSLISIVSGCAAFRGPPGPKLYDSVVLITNAENVLLIPPTTDKDFVQVVRNRLTAASKQELQAQGDLVVTDVCSPRTLKAIQNLSGITMSGESYTSGYRNPFASGITTTKKDDVRIATDLIIEDCETGKVLGSYPYYTNGKEPADVLKWISQWNIGYVYQHQHGPRPKL